MTCGLTLNNDKMSGMENESIEPGLLAVFRLMTALWLATEVLTLLARLTAGELVMAPESVLLELVDTALLLSYLSIPWLRRRLRQYYLPIGIVLATAGPVITEILMPLLTAPTYMFIRSGEPPSPLLFIATRAVIPVVYFPLILTAWQYGFRGVLVFCAGYFLLNFIGRDQFAAGRYGLTPIVVVNLMRTIGLLMVGYIVAELMNEQRKRRKELAEANRKLLRFASTLEQLSTTRERFRLAHELHDTLAHTQSALAVQLEGVDALWELEPDEAHSLLRKSVENTRAGLVETRRALQALRATPLDELGLILAIRAMAESAAERAGFALELSLPESLDNVDPDIEQCVYRVTQEALENVTRHANAQQVRLSLLRRNSTLELSVQDDGDGFDMDNNQNGDHFGLRGMMERARLVGGTLEIKSVCDQGTQVLLHVESEL